MLDRRHFLKRGAYSSTLMSLAPSVPIFVTRAAAATAAPKVDDPILVVVQLDGGNDGINTVVPFKDEGYMRNRRQLRLAENTLIKLTDGIGLHPAMRPASDLWQAGRMSIVQGVGYPNPNRSHFRSMAIWHTARLDRAEQNSLGWIGQGLDSGPVVSAAPAACHVGPETLPVALRGRRAIATSIVRPEQYQLISPNKPGSTILQEQPNDLKQFIVQTATDATVVAEHVSRFSRADAKSENYPATALGRRLRLVARLIRGGLPTRVYYAVQAGYDTHAAQLVQHADLLGEFAAALRAFFADLNECGLSQQVALLAFSEFGRRVKENGSLGTDHGTAGPVFLAGTNVRPGLHQKTPELMDLENGDLKQSVDFRQVYSTVLEDWLGVESKSALSGEYPGLPLFRSSGDGGTEGLRG